MVTFCEQKKLKKFILGFKVFCCPDLEKFLHEVVAKVVHKLNTDSHNKLFHKLDDIVR